MARVFFVTGSAGGVGVGNLQHRRALRKSTGGSQIVLISSLMRSATMSPPSDDLHNVLHANRPDAIPDENSITVQGILEKSQTKAAPEPWRLRTRSAKSHCHSSQAQPYQGRSRELQSQGTFSHWNLDLISLLVRMNGGTLF